MWAYQYASSGGIYAAQFVLAVYHGRIGRVSGRRKTPKKDEWHGEHRFNLDTWWKCGPFDVVEAMSTWDDYHRAAFIAWVNKPWFP